MGSDSGNSRSAGFFFPSYHDQNLLGIVSGVILVNLIFFLVSMVLFANPFQPLPHALEDGRGLNPMLKSLDGNPSGDHLSGLCGLGSPLCLCHGSFGAERGQPMDSPVPKLGCSKLVFKFRKPLRGQWAYIELGWGGYWAWDPVENASFLPWLTGTAFIHSVMIQERKGMFKFWNIALVILTYCLTLYGTFLVRSGILSSVHAFPKSNLSYWFGFFLLGMLIWAFYLLVRRRSLLKGEREITDFFSKETGFLLNNILLICGAVVIFLGTNLPIFTGILTGVKRVVGADWFNTSAGPVLLGVILLIGICSLLPWKKTGLKFIGRRFLLPLGAAVIMAVFLKLAGVSKYWSLVGFSVVLFVMLSTLVELGKSAWQWRKNGKPGIRRRLGGYLVHLGIVLIAFGVVGDAFYSVETVKTIEAGETISLSNIYDYRITFQGVKGREEGQMPLFTQICWWRETVGPRSP